jgi:hypothetical protein
MASPASLLAVLVAALLLGGLLGRAWSRRRIRRRLGHHRQLGSHGAARGLELLTRVGYRVVATEVTREGAVHVDGRAERFVVRADALVERGGRHFVAEFKGASVSASVLHRSTRRQLLEYALVFGVAGVLLVDAASGRVRVVGFEALRT